MSTTTRIAVAGVFLLAAGACQKLVGISDYRRDGGTGGRGGAGGNQAGRGGGTGGTGGLGGADADADADADVADGAGTDREPADAAQDAGAPDAATDGADGPVVDGPVVDGPVVDGPGLKRCPARATDWTGTAFKLSAGPHSAGSGQGQCGFPNAELPSGMAYAAVDPMLFNTMPSCGACLHVEHANDPSSSAEVQVIDAILHTAASGDHTFAVDEAVHRQLMPTGDNPPIRAWVVPCRDVATIKLVFQSPGGIPAIRVFGMRLPVTAVEFKTGAGAYVPFTSGTDGTRALWSPSSSVSLGPNATFRLTDQIGDTVEVTVRVGGGVIDTKVQFPSCTP